MLRTRWPLRGEESNACCWPPRWRSRCSRAAATTGRSDERRPRRAEDRDPAAVLGGRRGRRPAADRDHAQRRRGDLPLRRLQAADGEGGCAVPISVQTAPICNVKALVLDVRPTREPARARHHRARPRRQHARPRDRDVERHRPRRHARRASSARWRRCGRSRGRARRAAAAALSAGVHRRAAPHARRLRAHRQRPRRARPSSASPSAPSASGCAWRSSSAPRGCAGRRAEFAGEPCPVEPAAELRLGRASSARRDSMNATQNRKP